MTFRPEQFLFRPMAESDLETVRSWRNAQRVKAVMFTDGEIGAAEHRRWFEGMKDRPQQKVFVFEVDGRPIGFVNFSDLGAPHGRAVWGFYRGADDAPKGCGLAMGFFALERAFKSLGVRKIVGETFSFNDSGLRFHERLGFVKEGLFRQHSPKNGRNEDVVAFGLLASDWDAVRDRIAMDLFGRKADDVSKGRA